MLALVLILLLGAALRLYHLDRFSLWDDEARPFVLSSLPSAVDVVRAIPWFTPAQPPLDLLVRWAAMRILEPSTYAFTLVSVLFSTAGLICWFALFARAIGSRAALVATAILAFHPTSIAYAQTGRNYAIMDVVVPVASLLLLAAWRQGGLLRWSSYGFALAVAFYSHLLLASLGAAHAAVLLLVFLGASNQPDRRVLRRKLCAFAAALAFAGALCLPWAYYLWLGMTQTPAFVGPGTRYHTLIQVLEMSLPAARPGAVFVGLVALAGFVHLTLRFPRRGAALLVAFVVGYSASFAATFRNFFHFRYVYFLLPLVVACLALGLLWITELFGQGARRLGARAAGSRRVVTASIALGLVGLSATAWPRLVGHYARGFEYDGDWRSAARYVEERATADDLVVVPHYFHANHLAYATRAFFGLTDPDSPVTWGTEPWIRRARGIDYSVLPYEVEVTPGGVESERRVFVIGLPGKSTLGLRWMLDSSALRPLRERRSLDEKRFRGLLVAELAPN